MLRSTIPEGFYPKIDRKSVIFYWCILIFQWRAYENEEYRDTRTKRIRNLSKRKKKTKKVAWFVSNCNAKNNRLNYAKRLARYIQVTK